MVTFNAAYPIAAFDSTIQGTNGDDTLHGDQSGSPYGDSDFINGLGGHDHLYGGLRNDTLMGGFGDDYLDGGSGTGYHGGRDIASYTYANYGINASLARGDSRAINIAFGDRDTLVNLEGLDGSNHADVLEGNGGHNTITGNAGADVMWGGAGTDSLDGGADADWLFGEEGNDLLSGGGFDDNLDGGEDADGKDIDIASYAYAPEGRNVNLMTGRAGVAVQGLADLDRLTNIEGIAGSRFDDELTGDLYANFISGGDGDDEIQGNGGGDTLYGGKGDDRISAYRPGKDFASSKLYGEDGDDDLEGTWGADQIFGGEGKDRIRSMGGNDLVDGGAGDDIIIVNDGLIVVHGGAGKDALFLSGAGPVFIDLAAGTASSQTETVTFDGIEDFVGTDLNDYVSGSAVANFVFVGDGADMVHGLEGNDLLKGGGGNDHLVGGIGDDTIEGGEGADEVNGGAGHDTARYDDSEQAVIVDLLTGGTGGDAEGDFFIGIEAVNGSRNADTIRGTNNADFLIGDQGNDLLVGRGGADLMGGSLGNDTVNGDAGNDTLYGNEGDDTINGGEGDDKLFGGAGDDTLNGGAGNDTLDAGPGEEVMFGRAGNDRFQFVNLSDLGKTAATRDIIRDFVRGQDKIDLHFLDGDMSALGNNAFSFIGKKAFTASDAQHLQASAGELRYVFSGGSTIVAGDLNGDRVADFQIALTGNLNLGAGDFLL